MIYKSYRTGFTRDIPITSAKTLEDCIEKTEKYLFPWNDSDFEAYDSKDEVVYRSNQRTKV